MTSYAQFDQAITGLNAAEAFAFAAKLEPVLAPVKRVMGDTGITSLPDIMRSFANKAGSVDQVVTVDPVKVDNAFDLITCLTMLEAAEFTTILKQNPAYRV